MLVLRSGLKIKRSKKRERIMGFWSEVDMEIRSRMNKFKTSYDYEKEDTIRRIAKERYGKSEKK